MSSTSMLDTIIAQSKLSKKETAKQQKIVETAIRMFAEKGYANTSTSEIAKAAGVAEATIFRHYGTKENLLLSVIVPFLKESIPILAKEFIDEIKPENFDSFENFVRALLSNRMNFLKSNKEIFQVVVKEFLYREDLFKNIIPDAGKDIFNYFNKAMDIYKARGEIIDIPNSSLMKMILSFTAGYFTMKFILLPEDNTVDEDTEIDNMVRFILNGVKNAV